MRLLHKGTFAMTQRVRDCSENPFACLLQKIGAKARPASWRGTPKKRKEKL
jgi:hypothetical protein